MNNLDWIIGKHLDVILKATCGEMDKKTLYKLKQQDFMTIEVLRVFDICNWGIPLQLLFNFRELVNDLYKEWPKPLPDGLINIMKLLLFLSNLEKSYPEEMFILKKYYGLDVYPPYEFSIVESDYNRYSLELIGEYRGITVDETIKSKEMMLEKIREGYSDYESWSAAYEMRLREKIEYEEIDEIKNLNLSEKLYFGLYLHNVLTIEDFLKTTPSEVLYNVSYNRSRLELEYIAEFCKVKREILKSLGEDSVNDDEEYDVTLEDLGLRENTYKALKNSGIDTIQAFAKITFMELINKRKIMIGTRLHEIAEMREKIGKPFKY